MKQFFKILFACFFALVLFVVVAVLSLTGLVAGLSAGSEKKVIEDHSVLVIDLNEQIEEQGKDNTLSALSGNDERVCGLNEMIRSLKHAATDDQVDGVYIRTGVCNSGWASLKEMREALSEFRKSGKFVMAYGELTDQKSYYVASAADQVYLNPAGMFEFKGLAINGTFFKGALDKLDIQTEAFHCGKFKGAYEPFKLEKFSEPNRYQLGVLLQDMYGEFLSAVAKKTGTDTAQLAMMAEQGAVRFPEDALKNHFIDGVLYSDSMENKVKSKLKLGRKDKIPFVTVADYASTIEENVRVKEKVAVLYAAGEIHDGDGHDGIYSRTMTRQIRKIAADDQIKSVVLRVNSPGGSALASEVIWHELMELKKRKPLVISMGNYAASGGYYISCAGDSVFADENTLTGSIGVVGVMFNIEQMMKNKLGVSFDAVKTGTYADFPSVTRTMSEAERAWIQSYLDSTYILFKKRVADARKLSMEEVEDLAQGHVYSGTLAKQLKLIDAFGNKDRAIASAASMAKLSKYRVVEYPKPFNQIEQILASITGDKGDEAIAKKMFGPDYKIYLELKKLREKQNQIQAILPFQLEVR